MLKPKVMTKPPSQILMAIFKLTKLNSTNICFTELIDILRFDLKILQTLSECFLLSKNSAAVFFYRMISWKKNVVNLFSTSYLLFLYFFLDVCPILFHSKFLRHPETRRKIIDKCNRKFFAVNSFL